ncbi:uncharacterized protein PHALS_14722 [Plasmopara halstedii]|uniref:Uncharacterized protein n=1 Tax=Plasmopara halstedii TaxID=4781 RepID=A0A0P1A3T5_PLAHL|nr:uncharacterized protein PHALS_14722 [Plasmopara halstedii]CEG35108.1 hypothetical protein PHALS_14722 [Plasmopara halstedii]|eukprot:XP_024571477.1 hypothetical protein PHALS_14722 [Plasmopara halstedii]
MEVQSSVNSEVTNEVKSESQSTIGIEELERKQTEDKTWPDKSKSLFITYMHTQVLSMSRLELHRRCVETIERYSRSLRERERKMERLQLPLPFSQSDKTQAIPRTITSRKKMACISTLNRKKRTRKILIPVQSLNSSLVSKI